jgi:NAD(P) transhydrogenase subunit alpha
MPVAASRLYSANLVALGQLFISTESVALDFGDEILDSSCVVHDGAVRFEPAREALEATS